MTPTKTQLTGIISTTQGPLPLGKLVVRLSVDALIPGIGQILAGRDVTFTLDSDGSLTNAYLWNTAQMVGVMSIYYTVTALTAQGQIAFGPVQVTLPNVPVFNVTQWLQ